MDKHELNQIVYKFHSEINELHKALDEKKSEAKQYIQKIRQKILKIMPEVGRIYKLDYSYHNKMKIGYCDSYTGKDMRSVTGIMGFYHQSYHVYSWPAWFGLEIIKYVKIKKHKIGSGKGCFTEPTVEVILLHDDLSPLTENEVRELDPNGFFHRDYLSISINHIGEQHIMQSKYNNNYGVGFVYILNVEKTNLYKIGKSINVESRLNQIQTSTPFKLLLHKSYKCNNYDKIEKNLHGIYKDKKVQGEWFNLSYSDLNYIDEYMSVEVAV